MHRGRGLGVCLYACSLLFLTGLAFPVHAQVTTATLYGQVVDPTGGVVVGAKVQANNVLTGVAVSGVTNARGNFTIPYLPIGSYTVTVQAKGFRTYAQTGLELAAGQKVNLNIKLELGGTTQTITVSSAPPLVNSVSAQQDIHVNTRDVQQLPAMNRDITNILDLGAGTSGNGTTISLNGLPPRGFSFTIDGVDASPDSEMPSLSLYQNINFIKGISMDAVQEVQVSKNIFSAEIADTVSGNVNLISKSGTNRFHGSLFENYQAGGLNANNHLLARKSSLVFHQFGGSFGGPIKKDKLFFFTTFEGYRRNANQALTGQVPSLQARQEIIAAIPSSKPYFDAWPLPTGSENPGDVSAFFVGTGASKNTDNTGDGKVDWNINSNTRLSGRYSEGRPQQLVPRVIAGNPRTYDGFDRNVAFTLNRVWNPTFTSETRFGYNRSDLFRVDGLYSLGVTTITGAGLPGFDQARLFSKNGSTSTFEQNFAKTIGQHSLKFGGMYRVQYARRQIGDAPNYDFSTLSDILANNANTGNFDFGLSPFQLHRWLGGVFIQDDYRVRQNLMLNLGMRWDYQSIPTEQDGRLFNRNGPFGSLLPPHEVWNNSDRMFSPRFGFAWTVDHSQRTVVRGGIGIFYIPMNFFAGPVEIVLDSPNLPAELHLSGQQLQQFGIQYPDPNSIVKPLLTASTIIGSTAIDPNWKPSYSLQWSLGVERQLTNTVALDVGYVGNHGVRLTYDPLVNRVDRVTGAVPYPNFGTFRYYQNADSSVYDSLQVTLKKSFSKGLQFNGAYTYSSNLSYFLGDYNCCGTTDNPQDLNRLDLNRGPTSYFQRHRFTGQWVYSLPTWHGFQNPAEKLAFGGWEIGGVMTIHSGTPLLIRENVGNSPGARPDINPQYTFQTAVRSDYRTPVQGGTYQYLVPQAFIKVPISKVSKATVRPGDLSRNAIMGPGFWDMDLSLSKNFHVRESQRLELRVDLFNALNHTNYTGVQTNILSSQFGRITSVAPGRATQLSARYEF